MRAAIFASLVPAPKSEEQRKRLEDLIAIIVDWDQVKHGNSAKIREAQELIWQAFPDGPPRLIDPFMGGGATRLEALRLGCETHAVELNPAAHLIELCTLVYPQRCRNWRRGPSAPPAEVQRRDQCQPRRPECEGERPSVQPAGDSGCGGMSKKQQSPPPLRSVLILPIRVRWRTEQGATDASAPPIRLNPPNPCQVEG